MGLLVAFSLFAGSLAAQREPALRGVLEAYLDRAPMIVNFHYTFTQDDFRHDTSGVLILLGANVFRLELWDKVYGSDGSSLYLYDRNTHQTVIDSLRWSDLSLWLRLLNGSLPAGTDVVAASGQDGESRWELRHTEPWWWPKWLWTRPAGRSGRLPSMSWTRGAIGCGWPNRSPGAQTAPSRW